MLVFKCKDCSRVFNSVPSATDHCVTTHPNSHQMGEGAETYCTSVYIPQVRVVLTRVDSSSQNKGLRMTRTNEIKLDNMKASEIETVMASLFSIVKRKSVNIRHTSNEITHGSSEVSSGKPEKCWSSSGKHILNNKLDRHSNSSDSEYMPSDTDDDDDDEESGDEDDNSDSDTDEAPKVHGNKKVNSIAGTSKSDVRKQGSKNRCTRQIQIDTKNWEETVHYQCHFCKKVFKRFALMRHMKKAHFSTEIQGFVCSECGKTFLTGMGFVKHPCQQSEIVVTKQESTPEEEGYEKAAQKMKVTVNKKGVECNLCGRLVSDFDSLRGHMRLNHNIRLTVDKKYPCPLCESRLRNEDSYKEHMKLHLPGNPHVCKTDGCKQVFRNQYHLKVHMGLHTGVRSKLYQCAYCSSAVTRLGVIKKHFDSLHPGKTLKYTIVKPEEKEKGKKVASIDKQEEDNKEHCVEIGSIDLDDHADQSTSLCNRSIKQERTFSHDVAFEENKRKCHPVVTDLFNIDNDLLDEEIKKYPELVKSMRLRRERRWRKIYKCGECEWRGVQHSAFMRHIANEHKANQAHGSRQKCDKKATHEVPSKNTDLEKSNFLCVWCGFPAKDTTVLRKHVDKEHHFFWKYNERRFRCPFCGSRFLTENRKTEHIEFIHSSEKQHKCTFPSCGRRYSSIKGLNAHSELAHSNVSSFPCKECGEIYPDPQELMYHRITKHTRRKNQCKSCGSVYANTASLRRHVQMMHGEKTLMIASKVEVDVCVDEEQE